MAEVMRTWQAAELSPLALAFIGDAIWEKYVRDYVLNQGIRKPKELHRISTKYVRATAQAYLANALQDFLSDEEQNVLRRGRNAKAGHTRKSADVLEYRHSTGFEALIGYLYGSGQAARLDEVCAKSVYLIDNRKG
jgi:ribonuclease-3 family protein